MPRRVNLPAVPLYVAGSNKPACDDAVGVCKAVLAAKAWVAGLTDEQYEDALGELLASSVALAKKYDPTLDKLAARRLAESPTGTFDASTFVPFLEAQLPNRLKDWRRKEFGDERNKTQRAENVPIDDKTFAHMTDGDDYVDQIVEAAAFAENVSKLSDDGLWIMDNVARPLAGEQSHEQVASDLGISRRKVARLLEDLRNELYALAIGIDPTATTDEIVEALHGSTGSILDL